MLFFKSTGLTLAGLTLALVGCEPLAPPGDPSNALTPPPHKAEGHSQPHGISTPVPPVDPSPVPVLPSTAKGDMNKKDEPKPAEKKDEPKPAEKKADEPAEKKTETPK